jgi:hypothetical protein
MPSFFKITIFPFPFTTKKTPASPGFNPSEILFINLFYEEISTLNDEGNHNKVSQIAEEIYTAIRCKFLEISYEKTTTLGDAHTAYDKTTHYFRSDGPASPSLLPQTCC